MKKLACVLALSGAFVTTNAFAWGADGHRAVGAIADKLLKGTTAEKHIKELLQPGESLESIANWPDCVKGNYCGPQTQEMIDYVNANPKHSEYHYTDVPFELDHYHDHAVGTADDDIVQTLKQAIAVLRGQDDEQSNPHHFTRRQALILLTHMTGDIHQPLHVGAAYVGTDGKFVVPAKQGDVDTVGFYDSRGGNNFLVDDAKIEAAAVANGVPAAEPKPQRPDAPKNLGKPFHSYWDSTTVNYAFRRLSTKTPDKFAQVVIDSHPDVIKNTGDVSTWPYQWADDSLIYAKQAYADVTIGPLTKQVSKKGDTYYTWTMEVPANYPVPSSAIAKNQLIKGGYHLAAVLEAIWPN